MLDELTTKSFGRAGGPPPEKPRPDPQPEPPLPFPSPSEPPIVDPESPPPIQAAGALQMSAKKVRVCALAAHDRWLRSEQFAQ